MRSGYPELHVLDSTHPAAVKAVEARDRIGAYAISRVEQVGDDDRDQFFLLLFLGQAKQNRKRARFALRRHHRSRYAAGKISRRKKFRATFNAPEEVGGRYSALTVFGLVPAALIGVDVGAVLARARRMSEACAPTTAENRHPGHDFSALL